MAVLSGYRWQSTGATTAITWSFAEFNYPSLATTYDDYDEFDSPISASYRSQIQAAFDAWEAVANIDFVQVSDSATVNIRVGNDYIDGSGKTLAQAGTWRSGSYYRVAQITFDGDAYQGDFYQTALHEIGHAIGLDHATVQNSVMYYLQLPSSPRTLQADDIQGVQSIYGPRPGGVVTPDDYAATTATMGNISPGFYATGFVERAGDADWFRIGLTAGHTYRFDLEGSDTGRGTLSDPFLGLYNSAGGLLANYDDGGAGVNSRGTYAAAASGTFYLSAAGYENLTGTYRLTVTDITSSSTPDDYLGSTATTGSVSVGGFVTGSVGISFDEDWFRVTLTAGRTYRFDLEGSETGRGTLVDPYLELRSSSGALLNTYDDGGLALNSRGQFTATASGTYYLAASGFENFNGTYRLSVTDLSSTNVQSPQVLTAATNILREATSAAVADLATRVGNATLSASSAIAEIVKAADATTSVATLSYQFFTGKVPTAGGVDYLVSPTGGNLNNINSAYYQSFNVENRYINFAVNLGRDGDGQAAFQSGYGVLSLFDATKKAYNTIFGTTPSDTKAHALIDSRVEYFAYYGRDGANGLGTKAAMVGWLLAEAAKADVGMYSRANDAFLTDLADGAAFAVDLVGVYGKAEFNYAG